MAKQYEVMFTSNPIVENNISFAEAKLLVDWSKEVLVRKDRVTWFLRLARAAMLLNSKNDDVISFVEKQKRKSTSINDLVSNASIEFDPEQFINSLKTKLKHYLDIGIHSINVYEFKHQPASSLINELRELEEIWQKKQTRLVEPYGKPVMTCGKYTWYNLLKSGCQIEGAASGHCGNGNGAAGQVVYSLRSVDEESGKHIPHVTLILNGTTDVYSSGYTTEIKGYANNKPGAQYHDAIVSLFISDIVQGVRGGGYKAKNNFMLSDLPVEKQKEIYAIKPKLFTVDKALELDGYEVTDRSLESFQNMPGYRFIDIDGVSYCAPEKSNELVSFAMATNSLMFTHFANSLNIFERHYEHVTQQEYDNMFNGLFEHLNKKYLGGNGLLKVDKGSFYTYENSIEFLKNGACELESGNTVFASLTLPSARTLDMLAGILNKPEITSEIDAYFTQYFNMLCVKDLMSVSTDSTLIEAAMNRELKMSDYVVEQDDLIRSIASNDGSLVEGDLIYLAKDKCVVESFLDNDLKQAGGVAAMLYDMGLSSHTEDSQSYLQEFVAWFKGQMINSPIQIHIDVDDQKLEFTFAVSLSELVKLTIEKSIKFKCAYASSYPELLVEEVSKIILAECLTNTFPSVPVSLLSKMRFSDSLLYSNNQITHLVQSKLAKLLADTGLSFNDNNFIEVFSGDLKEFADTFDMDNLKSYCDVFENGYFDYHFEPDIPYDADKLVREAICENENLKGLLFNQFNIDAQKLDESELFEKLESEFEDSFTAPLSRASSSASGSGAYDELCEAKDKALNSVAEHFGGILSSVYEESFTMHIPVNAFLQQILIRAENEGYYYFGENGDDHLLDFMIDFTEDLDLPRACDLIEPQYGFSGFNDGFFKEVLADDLLCTLSSNLPCAA